MSGHASQASSIGPARIERVVDGDTLKVRLQDGRRKTVRVLGIDTPETKKPDTPVECGGPQASAAMRRLALEGSGVGARGRAVTLVADPSQDAIDRYGRVLAYVDADGRDLGQTLVGGGLGGGLRLPQAVPAAAGLPAGGAARTRRRSRRLEQLRGRLPLSARLSRAQTGGEPAG